MRQRNLYLRKYFMLELVYYKRLIYSITFFMETVGELLVGEQVFSHTVYTTVKLFYCTSAISSRCPCRFNI